MRLFGWNITRVSDDLPKLAVEAFQRLEVKPGDCLVLTTPEHLSKEVADQIRETFEPHVKDLAVKVLVLSGGMKIGAIGRTE